jgi:anthranilate synthase component 1
MNEQNILTTSQSEERFEFAADLETPVSAFLKLAPLNPVFLLESVERNETIGRYSFIGILPSRFFVLNQPSEGNDFFSSIEQFLKTNGRQSDLRLASGLVGFISFHASGFLLPKMNMKPSPFPLAAFVLPSAVLVFDHVKRKMMLSSILSKTEERDLVQQILTSLQTIVPLPRAGKSSEPVSKMSKAEFCKMVERAREYIVAGDIFQVVLSMQFEGESRAHPFQMYRALRMINPSPYMFYFNFQNQFQFFGSSPETLVRTEKVDGVNKVILRPIAGTRRRGTNPEEDEKLEKELLQDEKEKAEHLMLLDLARNDLGRIAQVGSVKVPEFMRVEKYSHVMHLVSTVESTVREFPSIRDLFASVFPAGTVSGAPKVRAMQIIDELEPHSRGLYAGSLGYFSTTGELDHCIAIRCIQCMNDRYLFTAGAGIVADSVPEREYEEILSKAMALRTMLKMSEQPL